MVKVSELSINVVSTNRPKVLIGLTQNGNMVGIGAWLSPIVDIQHHRRIEST